MYRIAGYVAPGRGKDQAVRAAARIKGRPGAVSHVELVRGSQWASASQRDGGVKIREIHQKFGHWQFAPIPDGVGAAIWALIEYEIDAPYNLIGALTGPTLGLRLGSGRFCSEIIATGAGLDRPWTWFPDDVFFYFERKEKSSGIDPA
jgi:hypothetical protein